MPAEHSSLAGGFTLLEVVVALAIAALALVGLFQAGSGGLFAVDTAARAEEAVQRAQSHLAAVGRDSPSSKAISPMTTAEVIVGGCVCGR